MTTLTYRQARTVVLGFGTALICGVAIAAYYRGADLVEVGAILLFLPILVGLAFDQVRGGLISALAVSGVYIAVRFSTIGDLPAGDFMAAAVVRTLLYVGLGVFGGWANDMLAQALRKLELYDEVDDDTGVGNARSLLSVADREVARADRYGSVFSFAVLHIGRQAFTPVNERRGRRALRRLCQTLESNVRATDLVSRVPFEEREDVVLLLPETGRAGAEVLLERAVAGARDLLVEHGLAVTNGEVAGEVISYPGDNGSLDHYRGQVALVLGRQTVVVEEGGA